MFFQHIIAIVAPTMAHSIRHWIYQLGGVGFIPLGILDASVIPLPGSMDVLTIVLSARDAHLWIYYALMATAGSMIGSYITYRLSRKGGKAMLERKFTQRRAAKICKLFERWGFAAIAIPAVLPPPVPMVPFLFAAGAMQYSVKKFLAALALGRIVRYSILAYLAERYGERIIAFISHHGDPVIMGAAMLIVTVLVILLILRISKSSKRTRK
jgi:membrane protein YqaA with SNARE-associated domain